LFCYTIGLGQCGFKTIQLNAKMTTLIGRATLIRH
jgi:hypothetical protein